MKKPLAADPVLSIAFPAFPKRFVPLSIFLLANAADAAAFLNPSAFRTLDIAFPPKTKVPTVPIRLKPAAAAAPPITASVNPSPPKRFKNINKGPDTKFLIVSLS